MHPGIPAFVLIHILMFFLFLTIDPGIPAFFPTPAASSALLLKARQPALAFPVIQPSVFALTQAVVQYAPACSAAPVHRFVPALLTLPYTPAMHPAA